MTTDFKSKHIGRKIERIRELKGMKQETLAAKIGFSQQMISKIEQSEEVDDEKLMRIAEALEVSVDTIKNFDEQAAINIVSSTFNDNASVNQSSVVTFNTIDKIVELYERLLKEREDIIELYKKQ